MARSTYLRSTAALTQPEVPRTCPDGRPHRFRVDALWESTPEDVTLERIGETCKLCGLHRYLPRHAQEDAWSQLRTRLISAELHAYGLHCVDVDELE